MLQGGGIIITRIDLPKLMIYEKQKGSRSEQELHGSLPLKFHARACTLSGYKIYGNFRHEESPNLIIDWLSNINSVSKSTASLTKTSASLTINVTTESAFAGEWNGSDSKVNVKPDTLYRLSWTAEITGTGEVGIFEADSSAQEGYSWQFFNLADGYCTFTTKSTSSEIGISITVNWEGKSLCESILFSPVREKSIPSKTNLFLKYCAFQKPYP